jgi:hypothetical protein
VSPIDPLGPLLQQIRASAIARDAKLPQRETGSAERSGTERGASAPPDWFGALLGAIAAIPPRDPQRRRKAFRLYLQAVLSREFAVADVEAPEFQALVDGVFGSLDASEQLRSAIERAADHLLATAAR